MSIPRVDIGEEWDGKELGLSWDWGWGVCATMKPKIEGSSWVVRGNGLGSKWYDCA